MTCKARCGFSIWLRALIFAMAFVPCAGKDSTGNSPAMYLVFFEHTAPAEVEHGLIAKNSEPVLKQVVEIFRSAPQTTICVVGNYDRAVAAEDRKNKSLILAESVTDSLVAQGVPRDSIVTTWNDFLLPGAPTEEDDEEDDEEIDSRVVWITLGDDTAPAC